MTARLAALLLSIPVISGCAARQGGAVEHRRSHTYSPAPGASGESAPRAEVAYSDSEAPSAARPPARGAYAPTATPSRSADRSAPASVEPPAAPPPVPPSEAASESAPRTDDWSYRPVPAPRPQTRLLTAASVGDVDRFDNYLSYLQRHPAERNLLGLRIARRVRFRVVDDAGRPVNDAHLVVRSEQWPRAAVHGRTHADGRWDMFPDVVAPQLGGRVRVTVQAGQHIVRQAVVLPSHGDTQDQVIRLPRTAARLPQALDLAFLIDVTGSMGDELRYVNNEIVDIVRRIRRAVPQTHVRLGATFYRDRQDGEPLRLLPFTSSPQGFAQAMSQVEAGGGGDYPEDMNAGLQAAMTRLAWRQGNVARVLVLIADAPPQGYPTQYGYHQAMRDASARGIRVLPVAASGANRTVEYLFRALGAVTSTPYVYLTDDSGIGNPHMEADTDRVAVERFNDLLTRLVIADLRGQGMHEPGGFGPQ